MKVLTKLRDRVGRSTTGTPTEVDTDRLGEITEDMQTTLQLRWWRWRYEFLEAKKLDVEGRRHET